MNESTSKKILFNKSSLLSLKAELLKKQEEVYDKKQLPQHKIENFKPAPSKPNVETPNNESSKKSFKQNLNSVDSDDLEANRKVKLALEKKAELYEHLKDAAGDSQLAGRFLVDFKSKKQQEEEQLEVYDSHTEDITSQDDENEWIEFTDCLGRTRKCLKSDQDLYLKRDQDLIRILTKDQGNKNENKEPITTPKSEKPLLVQKTNDYLQSLREKWEEKEQELLAKEKDIHYQDLLFDEARIHGVGYYSFSTDETERRKQMEELVKQRQDTLRAQQEAEQVRKKRDDLLAARVAAARARQRARAGLPPEEPKKNEKDFTTCLLEFLTQQKNEADAKAKEEEKKIREEKEKERQKLRETYIREWDLGKEGMDEKVKKFREMTQEEYVEQQRNKRIDEFAPPQTASSSKSLCTFDDNGRNVYSETNASAPKTWSDVRPKPNTPPPPDIGDLNRLDEQKGLYFTSSIKPATVKYKNFVSNQASTFIENELSAGKDVRPKANTPPPPDIGDLSILNEQKGLYFTSSKKPATVKYRNFVKTQEPIPIENELSDEEDSKVQPSKPHKRKHEVEHAEIAPPPTYDYYGPTPKHSRPKKPFESNIREAYAQGAKSLETKGNERQLSKQYDFTFD